MTRAEALEYYKQERDRFEKTRGIQWKFAIGLWTLIAFGIAYLDNDKIQLSITPSSILMLLLLVSHFLFAYFTQKGLVAARSRCFDILNSLNKTNAEYVYPDVGRKPTYLTSDDWWWVFFQMLSTNVLLLILLSVII